MKRKGLSKYGQEIVTRQERLKSALYLRLKMRKTFFLEKKLEFSEIFSRSENVAQCRKMYNGGPFLIYKHAFCCKITKKFKGGPFGTLKNFRKKVVQCRKNQKRDPLVSAGFVGYDKNGLTERGDPLQYLKCAARF